MSGGGLQTSDWFSQNAPKPTEQKADVLRQGGGDWFASNAPKQSAPKEEKSFLGKAWDWATTPAADSRLPKGMKTADILKGMAFEKMFGEPYIPGSNDFDSKAEYHLGD